MSYREQWIHPTVLEAMQNLVRDAAACDGAVIEFGCWEGRSFVHIAEAAGDRQAHAVDHWQGNDGDAYTTRAAADRDIFAAFLDNTKHLDNVRVHRMSTEQFMREWDKPIAFLHLDADHNYVAVKDQIEWALPLLVSGGVLCGDDYSSQWPGVTRAVDEILPEAQIVGAMWVHRND